MVVIVCRHDGWSIVVSGHPHGWLSWRSSSLVVRVVI